MFDINEDLIKSYSSSSSYESGLNYYLNGQVDNINLDIDDSGSYKRTTVSSKVKSASNFLKKYDVRINFTSYSTSVHGICTCKSYPRYYNQGNMCKHIMAVLIKYCKEKDRLIKKEKIKINTGLLNQIKNNLTSTTTENATKLLNLTFKLEAEKEYSSFLSLELKIGEQKLYVVKNIREFVRSVISKDELEFGKNFIFTPTLHRFKDEDKKIIDILAEIYETERTAADLARFGEKTTRLFVGKKAYLTESNAKKVFEALGDRRIDLILKGDTFADVSILNEDFPLEFKLESKDKELVLQQASPLAIPICNTGKYYFYDNNIYIPSNEQIEMYEPFYNSFIKEGGTEITFYEEETEDIASYVIPALKKISKKVIIDKNIQEKFYQEPLKTIIYFDKEYENVTASVIFKYRDIEFNALKDKEDKNTDKILVRDIDGESKIINTLIAFSFEKTDHNFAIKDEEKLLDFMVNGKDALQEISDIYYSESFKDMKVYTPKSYKSTLRLNDEDLLEFNFSIDGIDRNELKNIFDALKQKKKYYRLKKGGFVPLQSSQLQPIADMIDYLNISNSDFQKDKIIISKYNAAYIDASLKENNITFVERNKKFRELVNSIKDIGEIDYTLPTKLDTIMRDYQKFGFKWFKTLFSCGFGGILADEMGLGKTLQTIAFIKSELDATEPKLPTLVVCPTSLVYNWEDEIKKFQPDLKCLIVSGNKNEREDQRQNIEESDVVITSYALIRRDIEDYNDVKFKYCFLDEAQNIKNPDSLNAKSVKSIKANGYFALTGTPIENSLTELWSIFDFIMPGYLLSHRKFVSKYEIPIVKNRNKKALEELNKHIKPFILRRLKKDVVKELPPKIEHNMIVDMTDEQKRVYAAFLAEAKEEVNKEITEKGLNKSKIKILSILTRLRQICCDPSTFIENYEGENGKTEALMDILENNINAGHKILLFSQFTSVLKNIAKRFIEENINYMYLDGSTKAESRSELVKEFNEGDASIFLISLKAGGTGLNLTSADIVIHFDPWWNPAVEAQASDRAHRIGQKKTVEVIKLIAKGTIEEKIYSIQEKKKEMIKNVINENTNDDILLSNMNEKELEELFK